MLSRYKLSFYTVQPIGVFCALMYFKTTIRRLTPAFVRQADLRSSSSVSLVKQIQSNIVNRCNQCESSKLKCNRVANKMTSLSTALHLAKLFSLTRFKGSLQTQRTDRDLPTNPSAKFENTKKKAFSILQGSSMT